ncbi:MULTISPECIES: hydroxymethylglutaryl-CoA lyase [unclassified Brevibacillus]|jgi:hydroxymethylglutaryl-CoA lyase|uniref:hydroxymethylglutaryl-CoA lyase n=1 Tax=unclassified Brevibacillus TaxID=2684853 RepID=UPI000E3ADEB1|nr:MULTISPECIES: hydroxymethylglutaryl-CoA lyase [unclassified Brevibacillus]MBR8661678.1 hydroxymethylglutaryl-CoA lyase [Brevibacillus sp. NL20B1]NNV03938.1 hydroxymethylglutaryl-CoA lyase [Brevibacillus sp. MCWH]REK65277.1 MAG: hydroxymethylglutaryl-CoA lyase [Brevibacillus sp.]
MTTDVTIIEVGPRDGLQNEPCFIPTEKKLRLIGMLVNAGLRRIEAVSFVHPQRVPQMADAEAVMDGLPRVSGVSFAALIPNRRGFERAAACRLDEINWVTSASPAFNRHNINQTIEENLDAFRELVPLVRQAGQRIRFSIATSFGCPFSGRVDPDVVLQLAEQAIAAGADEIGVADTIGIAVPDEVYALSRRLIDAVGTERIALHLHDTRGLALANTYAAYTAGIRSFETAVGGLGGCPFAPGAAGNAATEDVVYMFERMKVRTGVDFSKLLDAADYAVSLSKRKPLGRIRLVESKNRQ